MTKVRSELDRFRVVRYDPILPEGWNALRAAILGLYDDMAALAARMPHSLFVTVRDAVTGDFVPPTWIEVVSATPVDHPEAPLPPGIRLGDHYLIANPEPGRYTVTVEPRLATGYLMATAEATVVAGEPASVDVLLARAADRRTIPHLFGASFASARDQLAELGLTIGKVMDAHGHMLDSADWPRFDDQLVISTEPGVDVIVPVGQAVDLLLAAIPFPRFPQVTGLPLEEAQTAIAGFAQSYGLAIEQVEVVEEERPEGTGAVIAQVPIAEAEIFSHSLSVRLVVAIPERVEAPNLIGLSRDEAAAQLETVGLTLAPEVEERETQTLTDHHRVAEQSPEAGERVAKGTAVRVVIWRFPHVPVPGLIGLTRDEAEATLDAAGLTLDSFIDEQPTDQPANDGRVAAQEPTPGVLVPQGSAVHITVWRFPRTAVPNLIGLTQEEATAALTDAKLTLDPAVGEQPTNVMADDGRVAAQEPAAGTIVLQGSTVHITMWRAVLITVPNVVGNTEAAAREILASARLDVRTTSRPVTDPAQTGTVLDQSPAAGAQVPQGTAVNIVIAALAPFPELRCAPLPKVKARVRRFVEAFAIHWDEVIGVDAWPSERERDTVIGQSPAQGTLIGPELSSVSVTVRRPPFPDLRCLHLQEHRVVELVKRWADQNGVNLKDIRIRTAHSDRVSGIVLAQKPVPLSAEYELAGTIVDLVVAKRRTQPLKGLPELFCLSCDEALRILLAFAQESHMEFDVRFEDAPSERPERTVLSQSPAPGTIVQSGFTITLTLARRPLPDVICLRVDEARERITRAMEGRTLDWQEIPQLADLPEGTVVTQKPLPGAPIPELESRITVTVGVSRGPRGPGRPAHPLTLESVQGIGRARSQKLRVAGIDDVQALAQANPAELARVLNVTETLARTLVERAQALLASHR
ncbi:MAG: PASTA domain-containing protein [Anaerolineae bacterium]|nr:PASTA domain-containing protein [Anaerolineae bacterium]MDW8099656.1 PASTA domain-containing protein [Anaerolineae bacterium]